MLTCYVFNAAKEIAMVDVMICFLIGEVLGGVVGLLCLCFFDRVRRN